MEKFEYKFLKLPTIDAKGSFSIKGKDINDIRIPRLEDEFNILGKEGWKLVEINWLEGLAIFIRILKQIMIFSYKNYID